LTSLWWKVRWNEIIFIQNQNDRSIDTKPLFPSFAQNTTSEQASELEQMDQEDTIKAASYSSPKASKSGTQVSYSFFALFDQHKRIATTQTNPNQTNHSAPSICPNRNKPQIRINDYFALPAYLHHFGTNRASGRAGNYCLKNADNATAETVISTSTKATPSKNSLTLQPRASSSGNNLCSLQNEQKQVSSESLAQIPNKGIYKVGGGLLT